MTAQMTTEYVLSEEMQSLVYWSSVYSAADADLDSSRAAYDAMCRHYTLPRDGKIDIEDHHLENAGQMVDVRLYRPKNIKAPATGWPCVLYFHGGGFVVGGLDSHEFLLSYICQDLNIIVLSVDYRLAPEHRFPAAYDDCQFAYTWLRTHAEQWNVDADNIIVAGDSAGGNLAAAVTVALQHTAQQAKGLVVIYPMLTTRFDLPAYKLHAHAPLLTAADGEYYLREYAPDASQWNDLRLAPLLAHDFSDMPESFIAIAEFDPLSDDGKYFSEKLTQAGIENRFYVAKGMLHGGLRLMRDCPEVRHLYQQMLEAIQKMIEKS
ncbi:alpha/beta hydrolase [Acinetobacter sp. ANC 4648]|uniref:alpha/beta hydrolase n=1 Tax=Acinetobacter sp. ANC 4648 TaxID=1977875 RepID=UPI000A331F0B|nr:alpha/beta hydrolase [Acinetobacter sp. ANC 4648]OTG81051.1 lipase [Acinetobacter sp. ANC 4648]